MAFIEEIPEQMPPPPPDQFVEFVTQSNNLAAELSEEILTRIGSEAVEDYNGDKESMDEWFDKMEKGLELARLVKQDKDYPFKNAANIKFPLVTSAALQFNARAYPAIVPSARIVQVKVWGSDPTSEKAKRAERISEHMSWQLSCKVEEWEEETDKLLVQLPIVGTMIRKWWFDPVEGRARCRVIEPGKFIVHKRVKNLSEAPALSEEIDLYPHEIESRIRSGQFVEFEYGTEEDEDDEPQRFIEQHTRVDLDEDGYPEPYIVTVHEETETVVRMVADFTVADVKFKSEMQSFPVLQETMVPQQQFDPMTGAVGIVAVPMVQETMEQREVIVGITAIKRSSYFVAYQFLPSMDGGFWGTGLGLLLGDISDSINSIINMLLDAGHYASAGGGFIGAELRMKGGATRLRPGEYKAVQAAGNDVRSAIVPLTLPGPDAVLFQMLGLLIDAGREIASVKDVVTGEAPNGSETATGQLARIEQGLMVFTAAYKRIFRALKKEFKMLAQINAGTITPEEYNEFHDDMDPQGQPLMHDPAADYSAADMDVEPVADPRSVTKMQQAAKANIVMDLARNGMANPQIAMMRIAEAMDIEDPQELMPQPTPPQQMMQQMQMAAAQADLTAKQVAVQKTMAEIEETKANTMKLIAAAATDANKVELERAAQRLEAMRMRLEHEDKQLGHLLGVAGRMAGESRNGSAQGGNAAGSAPQAGASGGAVFVGMPGA